MLTRKHNTTLEPSIHYDTVHLATGYFLRDPHQRLSSYPIYTVAFPHVNRHADLFACGVSHLHKAYLNAHFTKSNVHRLNNVATSYLYLSSASGLLRGVRKIPQNSVFLHISHLNGIMSPLIKAFNRFYP